jgi:type III pantothenate kinase
MNLLVDIGNTRIKWALHSDKGLYSYDVKVYEKNELSELLDFWWKELPAPAHVYVSNVSGEEIDRKVSSFLRKLWNITPIFLSARTESLGLVNAYEESHLLGIDRWLAMLAAWKQANSAFCVIDCGTAITVDVVASTGVHIGGYIIPGLGLMAGSLNSETEQIETTLNAKLSLEFGRNTNDCVGNGALTTIISLIRQVIDENVQGHGTEAKCIITGGSAEQIIKYLHRDVIYEPYLVLDGIALMSQNL